VFAIIIAIPHEKKIAVEATRVARMLNAPQNRLQNQLRFFKELKRSITALTVVVTAEQVWPQKCLAS